MKPLSSGTLPEFDLALWHGFNLPLLMSLLALAGGVVLFALLRHPMASGRIAGTPLLGLINGKRTFRHLLARLTAAGRGGVRRLGTRRLQPQLALLVLAACIAAAAPWWPAGGSVALTAGSREPLAFSPMFALLWAVGSVAAVACARQAKYHRLTSLALMSVAGLCTVITFAWFSAPDLALTQLSVETVTTVLILLGLRWLPKRLEAQDAGATLRARARRTRDLLLALAAGGGLAALSYALMTRRRASRRSS
jgi:multicomponent K+:H+ antiporter subunit A